MDAVEMALVVVYHMFVSSADLYRSEVRDEE